MKPLRLISTAEQVAAHLREEIESGALAGEMPGAKKLAQLMGINHKTVDSAAQILENQGVLEPQGSGMPRKIVASRKAKPHSLRVGILIYEPEDARIHVILEIRHILSNAGHTCIVAEKSQVELRWDVDRVARMVDKTKADAWVVQSGSREILEWFSRQPLPVIALYGRFAGLPVAGAGVAMIPAIITAVDQLIALGHRRIVMFAQETDIIPTPGAACKAFLERLEKHGIQTSNYNLPRWTYSREGLTKSLDSLFQFTPPTALFITDVVLFFPVYLHLLRRGIRVPEDVSLISTDNHPQFNWCQPTISYLDWDAQALIHRILNWTNNVAKGKQDMEQALFDSKFVANETIGPAR